MVLKSGVVFSIIEEVVTNSVVEISSKVEVSGDSVEG
jgi:hypothetical protein